MRMSLLHSGLALAATAALLSGCATDQGAGVRAGVSVTRFHLGDPIARGSISVEPGNSADAGSLEFAQLSGPVARELARLGWTIAPPGARSEQVATMRVVQTRREGGPGRRSGISIGIGGGTGGYRNGVDVGVGGTIPIGRARDNGILVTSLAIRIQRRSDATVAWEGRAEIEATSGSPLADQRAAVDRLATALFQDFPGESGRTITVR